MTDLKILIPLIFSVFLCGCVGNTVVCNPPYIQVGTGCCLDQNNNGICDIDDMPTSTSTSTSTTTSTSTSTTTTTTSTSTSTSTTTTTSTTSTTTTTLNRCGEKYCAIVYPSGECRGYGTITQWCLDEKTIVDCDSGEKHPCDKGFKCVESRFGAHCEKI